MRTPTDIDTRKRTRTNAHGRGHAYADADARTRTQTQTNANLRACRAWAGESSRRVLPLNGRSRTIETYYMYTHIIACNQHMHPGAVQIMPGFTHTHTHTSTEHLRSLRSSQCGDIIDFVLPRIGEMSHNNLQAYIAHMNARSLHVFCFTEMNMQSRANTVINIHTHTLRVYINHASVTYCTCTVQVTWNLYLSKKYVRDTSVSAHHVSGEAQFLEFECLRDGVLLLYEGLKYSTNRHQVLEHFRSIVR